MFWGDLPKISLLVQIWEKMKLYTARTELWKIVIFVKPRNWSRNYRDHLFVRWFFEIFRQITIQGFFVCTRLKVRKLPNWGGCISACGQPNWAEWKVLRRSSQNLSAGSNLRENEAIYGENGAVKNSHFRKTTKLIEKLSPRIYCVY